MRRLITLSLILLFTALSVSLIYLGVFLSDQIKAVERMQASRSQIKAQIHDALYSQYAAKILETRLLGRCGITVYIVTLHDTAGKESTLYFNIGNGAQIQHNLLNGCPRRMSGSATPRGLGTDTGV